MLAEECCWQFLKRLSLLASACVVASAALPAQAIDNPYAYVVGASAMNMCLVRFGYITTDQAVELLFDAASDQGISNYQVSNLVKGNNFELHMNEMVETFGGCQSIISKFITRKGRSKRTIQGGEKGWNSDLYYGENHVDKFGGLKGLNP